MIIEHHLLLRFACVHLIYVSDAPTASATEKNDFVSFESEDSYANIAIDISFRPLLAVGTLLQVILDFS
jgi:hypothetical protein